MIAESVWIQLVYLARRPGQLAPLVVTPLYSVVFFAVARAYGLPATAVTSLTLTATTMAIWGHAIFVASEALEDDRYSGTLELFLSVPDSYRLSLIVRILTAAGVGVLAFAEVVAVGWLTYQVHPHVRHVLAFVVALFVAAMCAGATAVLLSTALLLSRAARTMQNAVTYPIYVLTGMLLPRDQLPGPVRVLSDILPMSWAVDGLRSAAITADGATAWRYLGVAAALCAALLAVGAFVLGRVLDRLRDGGVALHA